MPGVGPGHHHWRQTGRGRSENVDVGCWSYLGSHLWQVRLELSLAWTQISVSLISSLNSLNLYSEEEPGNRAGWSQDCPAVKLFICQFLLAEAGCGYKLIVMSGDWTRLDRGLGGCNESHPDAES